MTCSFTPAALKGIVFLVGESHVATIRSANFGSELSVLANSWKDRFGGADVPFLYTMPTEALAPGVTQPAGIRGRSVAVEISDWQSVSELIDAVIESAL